MSNDAEQMLELELGRNWPEQIIVDHAPYWRAWRKQGTCGVEMQQFYALVGRHWILFANGRNLGPQLMVEWLEHVRSLGKGRGALVKLRDHQVNKYRMVVRAYLRWLYLMGAIMKDPGDCMPKVRPTPPAEKLIYTHQEYKRGIAYAEAHPEYMMEEWLWVLGYHSGMSLVDCCLLNWSEVELPDNAPCVIRRVREKLRCRYGMRAMSIIPIITGGELWVWFKRLERRREREFERDGEKVYVHPEAADECEKNHRFPSSRMISFITSALGKDRNGRNFRHLRNTFASRMINAGNDSVLVSKMTGHKSLTQLADYVIPDQGSMQEAVLKGMRFAEGEPKIPAQDNDQTAGA